MVGGKEKAASYLSPSLKHKIKRFVNLFSKSDNSVEDFVPYKYAQYEGYYEKCKKVYVYSMKSGCWNGQILFISMEKVI